MQQVRAGEERQACSRSEVSIGSQGNLQARRVEIRHASRQARLGEAKAARC
jgi:hypothetical protein